MKKLIYSLQDTNVLKKQIPMIGTSFITAELLFKFGSFTLEAFAFGAVWFILDYLIPDK